MTQSPDERLDRIEEDGIAWGFTARRAKTRAIWLGLFSAICAAGVVAVGAYALAAQPVYDLITFFAIAAGAAIGGGIATAVYYIETEKNHHAS